MTRKTAFTIALSAIALAASIPVFAHLRQPYSVEVLVDGRPLQPLHARGQTYVEARNGREYAIRLRNNTGRRVAVALSVDGLNSIDARRTTARDASKWVVGPYQTLVVDGWQTSNQTARKFFFTTEDRSYGDWLGKTENLGMISAAFFREVEPEQPIVAEPDYSCRWCDRKSRAGEAKPQAAPEAGAPERRRLERDAIEESEDHAATGIGREVDNRVRRVDLEIERKPIRVTSIRYEFHDALVDLGVLPRDPLARRERATGFMDFAPDPYR